jgi:hypothetical protein
MTRGLEPAGAVRAAGGHVEIDAVPGAGRASALNANG